MTPSPESARPLVIFDCDGVLVDSERLLQRIDIEMIADLGWPITRDEIHAQHLGRTVADIVANIEQHIGRPVPDDFLARRDAQLMRAFEAELEAVPGVADALDALESLGYSTCVASSGPHQKLRATLGRTGLYARFAGRIYSAHDVERGKPAPDLFLHAAEQEGRSPASCVVVEDSPAGIEAARAAGMRAVGYAGETPRQLLRDADVTVDSMERLVAAIEALDPKRGAIR